jgi:hypothetical protein
MRTPLFISAVSLLTLACQAHIAATPQPAQGAKEESLDIWSTNHPEASRDLGVWVQKHPEAAARFFKWDARHAGAAKAFVTWSIAHPGADMDEFAFSHREWDEFNWIMEHHHPAANAFMQWCRKHPRAAESLMNHPGGLDWAGRHLYQASWDMKHEGL